MSIRNKLRKLRLFEVSLVDDPANPHARVSIAKRGGDGQNPSPVSTDIAAIEALAAVLKARGIEPAALAAHLGELDVDIAQALEALKKANATADQLKADLATAQTEATTLKAKVATLEADVTKRAAEVTAAQAEVTALKGMLPADKQEELLLKSADPAVAHLAKSNKELREQLAKAEQATAEAVEIGKARDLKLPEPEKIGPAMLRISKGATTAEDAKLFETTFKALSAQAAASEVFKRVGGGNTPPAPDSAMAEITKRADAMITAQGGKITKAAAISRVTLEDPELAARADAEHQHAARRAAAGQV